MSLRGLGASSRAVMLRDEIQQRLRAGIKNGNTTEREILRVVFGELQTVEAREGQGEISDEKARAVVRKLMKSVTETLSLTESSAARVSLEAELAVLQSLVPSGLDVDQLIAALTPVTDAIKSAPNDGAATGIAMRALKSSQTEASGKDVAEAVKRIRQTG